MGIILKQSFFNTLIIFLGFGVGGINVLFLYTHFSPATLDVIMGFVFIKQIHRHYCHEYYFNV